MGLIKQQNTARLMKDAIVLDLGDLRREADRIRAAARAEAEGILEDARDEAATLVDRADVRGFEQGVERGLREGREEGQREGRAEAIAAAEAELRALADGWSEALRCWESERNDFLLAVREDVLRFAFAMAEKIVLRTGELDPTVVQDQIAEALRILGRPSSVVVVVHPDELDLAEETLPALREQLADCDHVVVEADASIARGGCIVRTAGGQVDATLETQIERIARTLLPRARGHDE